MHESSVQDELDLGLAICETPSEFFDLHDQLIQNVARQEHKGSELFSRDDLEQEIRLALLRSVDQLMSAEATVVAHYCHRAARAFAMKERLDWEQFTGQFIYTPAIVKVQLEQGFLTEEPDGDWDMRMDVQNAWGALPPSQADIVYRAYVEDSPPTDAVDRKRLGRAIDRMARSLNSKIGQKQKREDLMDLMGKGAV